MAVKTNRAKFALCTKILVCVPFLFKVVFKKFLGQKWLFSTRYFGDLAKLLWQPLKIDFDMIFRSAILYFLKYMHRTAQIFRTCSV